MTRTFSSLPLKKRWVGKKGRQRLRGQNIFSNQLLHGFFMRAAIFEAKKAEAAGEVPIGGVIVYKHQIIARAGNRVEEKDLALCHAEMILIHQASKILGRRLKGASLYVTLEPCPMCAGAIVQARVSKLIYGARDLERGGCGSMVNCIDQKNNLAKVKIYPDVLGEECLDLLQQFFQRKRKDQEKL